MKLAGVCATSAFATLLFSAVGCTEQRPQPNVLVFLADDLGYGDLASYGSRDVATPNLDQLASLGARFTDAYAASPVCSPTRIAFLTGRYPQRLGHGFEDYGTPGLDPALYPSLATFLRPQGYSTAIYGKWNVAGAREADFTPNAHGFDHWVGTHHNHNYHTHNRIGTSIPDFWENGRAVKLPGYTTRILANRAVQFIRDHAEPHFFLFVSFLTPHYPIQLPQTSSIYPRDSRGEYTKMVEYMDQEIGRILSAVRRRGVLRDTLVIFTSDNGGAVPARNKPFRGAKQGLNEGGIRVPLIISWPRVIPPGVEIATPATTMDLTATILAAAGARQTPPATDGIDLIPVILGEEPAPERSLYWRRRIVRPKQGVDRIVARAVRDADWKLLIEDDSAAELYNLRLDPGEEADMADQFPELATSLKAKLADWENGLPSD